MKLHMLYLIIFPHKLCNDHLQFNVLQSGVTNPNRSQQEMRPHTVLGNYPGS